MLVINATAFCQQSRLITELIVYSVHKHCICTLKLRTLRPYVLCIKVYTKMILLFLKIRYTSTVSGCH